MNRLEVTGVQKHFGGITALSDAYFSIGKGEVCGLLGANGSGKTTLSRIIAGLYKADGGKILFDGREVKIQSPKKAREIGIAMAHQNLSLVDEMTVWENICLGNEPKKGTVIDNDQCKKIADEALALFGLTGKKKQLISSLSPSEKQLVEICKAIAQKPKLLILDEPTAPLEFAQVNLLFDIVRKLKEEGTSIVFISHRMWEVTQICDKVVVLRNGKTVSELNMHELEDADHHKIILKEITGKEQREGSGKRKCGTTGEVLLKVDNLNLRGLLHDVSFEVAAGEIVGISGLQGMGQEELLLVLSGHLQRSGGEVVYKGKQTKWRYARQAISNGVVLVPGERQKEGLFLSHTVFDNLMYPEFSKKGSSFVLNNGKLHQKVDELMDQVSLVPHDDAIIVNNLSGGNQQKVVVGKWIAQKPDILLMSDPAKGIDVDARFELYEICKAFAEEGKAVLLYASDNHELIDICDRVLVMFEGKIVAEVCREDLSEERLMEAALHMKGQEERA